MNLLLYLESIVAVTHDTKDSKDFPLRRFIQAVLATWMLLKERGNNQTYLVRHGLFLQNWRKINGF